MNLRELLFHELKSDEVVEVLEHFEIEVVYDFDRSHEGLEDLYWAPARKAGFQLRFNKEQRLDTIFLYVVAREGFHSFDRKHVDVPFFSSFREAESQLAQLGVPVDLRPPRWIKGVFGDRAVHYEFDGAGGLSLVTITWRSAA